MRLHLEAGQALEPQCLKADVIVGERNVVPARVRHQQTAPGKYLLRVQTLVPLSEPVLAVQLEAGCSWRLSRRFVVLADPQQELRFVPPAAGPSAGAAGGAAATTAPARPRPAPGGSLRMEPVEAAGAQSAPAAGVANAGLSQKELDLVEQALAAVVEAGNAVRSAQAAASEASSRALGLERTVQQLRAEAQAQQQAQAALNERLAQSELRSNWVWPLAAGVLAIGGLAAWLAWQLAALRKLQNQAGTGQGEAGNAVAGAASRLPGAAATQGEAESGASLSPPSQPHSEPAVRSTAPAPFAVSTLSPASTLGGSRGRDGESTSSLFGDSPGLGADTQPALLAAAPRQGGTPERAQVFARSTPSAFDSLPAQRTRPLAAAPSLGQLLAAAPGAAARDISIEELIDLEQQAEFFIVLGQEDAAVDLLVENIRSSGGASPLPYLKLLEIHRRRGEREAYERTRTRFNQRFNAYAAEWSEDPQQGRSLQEYPEVLPALVAAWPKPLDAMAELEALLFRRMQGQVFDLPAYRELLFLYAMARDLLDREAAGSGNVDLLLPLPDAPAPAPLPEQAQPAPASTRAEAPMDFAPTEPPVDLELEQEPARRRIFDSLRSSRLPGYGDRQP